MRNDINERLIRALRHRISLGQTPEEAREDFRHISEDVYFLAWKAAEMLEMSV